MLMIFLGYGQQIIWTPSPKDNNPTEPDKNNEPKCCICFEPNKIIYGLPCSRRQEKASCSLRYCAFCLISMVNSGHCQCAQRCPEPISAYLKQLANDNPNFFDGIGEDAHYKFLQMINPRNENHPEAQNPAGREELVGRARRRNITRILNYIIWLRCIYLLVDTIVALLTEKPTQKSPEANQADQPQNSPKAPTS